MLQAFPHQRFGTVKGAIKTISRTVLGPTEISIPGLKIAIIEQEGSARDAFCADDALVATHCQQQAGRILSG